MIRCTQCRSGFHSLVLDHRLIGEIQWQRAQTDILDIPYYSITILFMQRQRHREQNKKIS